MMDCPLYCTVDGAADRLFVCLSTVFKTDFQPYFSADGGQLLILPLVYGFHDGLPTVLHSGWRGGSLVHLLVNGFHDGLPTLFLSGWRRIAYSSTRQQFPRWIACYMALRMAWLITCSFDRQWLSPQFMRWIAQWILADSSYFRSSTAFTKVCVLYCSADGSGLLIPPLVHGFPNGSHVVLLSGWLQIVHSFSRQ